MPLFFQQNINASTRLGIWHITEPEEFFLAKVPLQKNITHPHKRLQHLAGRYLLQYLFPDFPYNEILIADTRKPYLPNDQYHFSISHCSNYAAVIISKNKRVGIDIEVPTERVLKITKRFLSEVERANFLTGSRDKITDYQLQTILWSAKEAIFKWWSYGSVDFSENIFIENFKPGKKGTITALFKHQLKNAELGLHYHCFDDIYLVWLYSNNDRKIYNNS
ncbi:MAG: 4'-phosphopantetheinyl transferase family protein [Ilyomonas sp.]